MADWILASWGSKVRPADAGRPSYDPAALLTICMLVKIYIYGYLNRVQSSQRLEHECLRNVELMWLTGRAGAGLQDHRGLPA